MNPATYSTDRSHRSSLHLESIPLRKKYPPMKSLREYLREEITTIVPNIKGEKPRLQIFLISFMMTNFVFPWFFPYGVLKWVRFRKKRAIHIMNGGVRKVKIVVTFE